MSALTYLRENWRLLVLVVLLVLSVYALFVPGGAMGGGDSGLPEGSTGDETQADGNDSVQEDQGTRLTNLAFGLDLDGGARISAPPVGTTAEDVRVDDGQAVRETLREELDLDAADVGIRYANEDDERADVEIYTDEVSDEEFVAALDAADVDASEDDVRDGVTKETRDEIVETIDLRINAAGLDGGRVVDQAVPGGDHYIVTEVPGMTVEELRSVLEQRGTVEIRAYYPEDGNQTNETVLGEDDIVNPGSATTDDQTGQHYVPVTVSDEHAPTFQDRMVEMGFTDEGLGSCNLEEDENGEFDFENSPESYCLLTVVDGEVVDAHSMGNDLGQSMADREWENDPGIRMMAPSQEEANQLSVHLQSGSLTAPLDFDRADTYSLTPALADRFKSFSLVIGLLSVLAVSGVVFARYRDPRVAAPMVLTATSEVVILLGFAAAISMPLDLAHVAGFIAVIGTGVDDLVIIADEVMSEGDVNQAKIFDSRFKKAFWVIGAAAATTIIAMSPLAVLSLGDLQGFAIVTILGVLVGVFVTRPAYGDILRRLLLDER